MPAGFPFQDYGQLIDRAAEQQIGVIAIRVLAGGALSGSGERNPNAAQTVEPIASGSDFAEDVERARTFQFLVDEGYAGSLAEAAVRFAIGNPSISTVLVGISNMEQLEQAIAAANKGPLPAEALGPGERGDKKTRGQGDKETRCSMIPDIPGSRLLTFWAKPKFAAKEMR